LVAAATGLANYRPLRGLCSTENCPLAPRIWCRPPVFGCLTGWFTGLWDSCIRFCFVYFVIVASPEPVFYRLYTGGSRKIHGIIILFLYFQYSIRCQVFRPFRLARG
jgi:hypothetical protein